ncbi:hypothetical protein FHX61_005351 [Cupriavidus alkaliphilus]|uniref:Uncharacterized protein n=1 Tax=Cupriavidus alkaliphilus TaxID=942866 RepID=A0A7W4VFJ5_9BURK|nr:hypothetical protein [Cupriavidus alkaliphilus]
MTIAHIWMFASYCVWMDMATGAWLYSPRPRKVERAKC